MVFETGADGEEIFDPEDVEDDAFDRSNDTVRPEPEPIGTDPKENNAQQTWSIAAEGRVRNALA